MKEFKTILSEFKKIDLHTRKAALATVVKVRGSSYRSPGARMLITDDGKWVGSISGGCLEGDALRKAREVMQRKVPRTVTYDTREESNQNLGIGLGCNGVIDVLIEAIDPSDGHDPITVLGECVQRNDSMAMATIFHGEAIGQKLLIDSSRNVIQRFSDGQLNALVETDLIQLFDTRKSLAKTYPSENGEAEIFIELIQPSISLVIFGGGFDARPVSQLARMMGWDVMVTDECVAHIAPVFFPDASKLSLCHRDFVDREMNITPYTACILMSHNYEYDRDVLKKLINTLTPYIGILGPRKRFDKMLDEFSSQGIHLDKESLHRIHSPMGLDIGAETPDEIAMSIIAEIQGVFSNRSGGFLKYRTGPIHQRDHRSHQVFKEVYLAGHSNKYAQGQ